jgi:hypothetical protein
VEGGEAHASVSPDEGDVVVFWKKVARWQEKCPRNPEYFKCSKTSWPYCYQNAHRLTPVAGVWSAAPAGVQPRFGKYHLDEGDAGKKVARWQEVP